MYRQRRQRQANLAYVHASQNQNAYNPNSNSVYIANGQYPSPGGSGGGGGGWQQGAQYPPPQYPPQTFQGQNGGYGYGYDPNQGFAPVRPFLFCFFLPWTHLSYDLWVACIYFTARWAPTEPHRLRRRGSARRAGIAAAVLPATAWRTGVHGERQDGRVRRLSKPCMDLFAIRRCFIQLSVFVSCLVRTCVFGLLYNA